MKNIYFISGIDTNIGKTFATGLLAKALTKQGKRVITQKMIQTGCEQISEDIEEHRRLQGIELLPEDLDGTTCPYLFTYPCSPHLAARLDKREIVLNRITEATERLANHYDIVLLEGAGGLMVPIDEKTSTIDYVAACDYPVILVTSGRLGSINHTLLSLEACRTRGLHVAAVLYNDFPVTDTLIADDTFLYLTNYLSLNNSGTRLIRVPEVSAEKSGEMEVPSDYF